MNLINRPVWVEINTQKYAHNLQQVRERVGKGPLIMAVVKADAYGHGSLPMAGKAVEAGADRLGVALVEEGVELRQGGIEVPIQAMSGFLPAQIDAALEHDIILTIGNEVTAGEVAKRACSLGKRAVVHVKVDTGMGRLGPLPDKAIDLAREVSQMEGIELEGLMSHMSSADEPDKTYSRKQFQRFEEVISALKGQGIEIPLCHIANSATIIDLPEMALDMVRPGIMSYGLWPSGDVNKEEISLQPVLQWKARLVQVKEMPPGSFISYGRTYETSREQKLALLPLGYADGFNRLLSNKGEVLIRGQRVPVRGRVCMDQVVVDVSAVPGAEIGDEVVIIGKLGQQEITVDEIAGKINTINYEVVCMINKRVPRFLQT